MADQNKQQFTTPDIRNKRIPLIQGTLLRMSQRKLQVKPTEPTK